MPSQEIRHTPDNENNNRSHSDIIGPKEEEERLKFQNVFEWCISPWD